MIIERKVSGWHHRCQNGELAGLYTVMPAKRVEMKWAVSKLIPRLGISALAALLLVAALLLPALPVYADTTVLAPNGAGDKTNIPTLVGAATHWQANLTNDGNTSYVACINSSTWRDDLYNMDDGSGLAIYGTINSVTVTIVARVTNTASQTCGYTKIKTNGSEYNGTAVTLTTSYTAYSTVYNTNPNTGLAWTWDEVNNLQAGVAVRRGANNRLARCTQVYVTVDYTLPPPDIVNDPNSYGFGVVTESSTPDTGLTYFTITNNSVFTINITIGGTDMTGGSTWTLSDTATPGADTFGMYAGLEGGSFSVIVKKNTPYNMLVSNLVASGTQRWGIQLLAPTLFSDGGQKSGTLTLTATQA